LKDHRIGKIGLLLLGVQLTACPSSPKSAPPAPPPAQKTPAAPVPPAQDVPAASADEPKPETKGTQDSGVVREGSTTGKFETIEEGDYFYLVIQSDKGESESFRCRRESHCEEVQENAAGFKGKRMRVDWVAENVFIPEAGATVEVQFVKHFEFL
jgi:hypothetical protein